MAAVRPERGVVRQARAMAAVPLARAVRQARGVVRQGRWAAGVRRERVPAAVPQGLQARGGSR